MNQADYFEMLTNMKGNPIIPRKFRVKERQGEPGIKLVSELLPSWPNRVTGEI